jgi:amino acid transporter
MSVLNIIIAIVLVILCIFMFFLQEETTNKFFLTKRTMNGLATIVLMIGILFALTYFSETVTAKLIDKLRAPIAVTTTNVPSTKPNPEATK